MSTHIWSVSELREYVRRAPELRWADPTELERYRDGFRRSALALVVPEVRRRLLASIGTATNEANVALMAQETIESGGFFGGLSRDGRWMLLSEKPWDHLIDCVVEEIEYVYKGTGGRKSVKKALAGIAAASSRAAIDAPAAE